MKSYVYLFVVFIVLFASAFSCKIPESSNEVLNKKQEQLMEEANRQVGMPAITNFTERKLLKSILERRDQTDLVMFAYTVPELTGKPVFLGKCVGYGIPYATEYTNPEIVGGYSSSYYTLPQADPNGLFMPASADGTWLMLIDPTTGEPGVVYIEPKIMVSPFKLPNAVY